MSQWTMQQISDLFACYFQICKQRPIIETAILYTETMIPYVKASTFVVNNNLLLF